MKLPTTVGSKLIPTFVSKFKQSKSRFPTSTGKLHLTFQDNLNLNLVYKQTGLVKSSLVPQNELPLKAKVLITYQDSLLNSYCFTFNFL